MAPLRATVEGDWSRLSQTRLEELVAEALEYNADLREAAPAPSARRPMCARPAGSSTRRQALWRGGGEMSGDEWPGRLAVSASWEVDLWGRVRYSKRSAEEQYASTEADYVFARQSLAALVAKSWFLATEAALQEDLLTQPSGPFDAARSRGAAPACRDRK